MNDMQLIIESEVAKHNISIIKWSGYGGRANGKGIKIPKPVDFMTFGTCFHEIGHVVLGHVIEGDKTRRYIEEYEAEQYAINKLKEYGFYNKTYEISGISYVLSKIAQAKNRGHNMKMVPKEIVRWTGLQINKWNKAKKVFVYYGIYKIKKDIIIELSWT